ncbi:hypothetical protein PoB_001041800 [Plakobranchus ocellatus]|uniref:Uncharacterized protein n=1 Tax=Plakobranchus ocellatus TaxID=259542 RepID=A0AAV3YMX7_9GAST|nr:hypothetical protein PoB_001041800 [Plakobranchus ocellatus]
MVAPSGRQQRSYRSLGCRRKTSKLLIMYVSTTTATTPLRKAPSSETSSVAVTTETVVMFSPPATTTKTLALSPSQSPISSEETPEVSGHQWLQTLSATTKSSPEKDSSTLTWFVTWFSRMGHTCK